ncbi:MAG: Desaturase [uncultured Campylobacterales bacterium]|uniref:Desaturase n=1 Tax=uncultured Campylobacterales bacterium TaxID=352960 RepID=A0A6S6T0K7_9BACT|nr:MAG: Desaturase [uncultured Campylobacterales bacterium]
MILPIILFGIFLIILERIIPDRKLPSVKNWWIRVVFINLVQLLIVIIGIYTWDAWFKETQFFQFDFLPDFILGFLAYFVITFIFYWWHRLRHDVNFLWLLCHQVHHSASRIETITSFYKHPLEILINSILIGAINYLLFGLNIEAAAWSLLYTSIAEYFYHMNIRTPYVIGFFLQRPEMHRIHHKRGFHYNNFSDLPLWDMLFGTFDNPKIDSKHPCGFNTKSESNLFKMLIFKNVNKPYKKKPK